MISWLIEHLPDLPETTFPYLKQIIKTIKTNRFYGFSFSDKRLSKISIFIHIRYFFIDNFTNFATFVAIPRL